MRLGDVKVGEKFYHLNEKNQSDRMYLRIDMDLKMLFPTLTKDYTSFSNLVPALDLTTYRISCLSCDYEVEVEHDNVYI